MTAKVAIAEVPLQPASGAVGDVMLRAPGLVRGAVLTLVPRSMLELDGTQRMDEILSLIVECDPGAPMRSRRFLVMQTGHVFTPKDGVRPVFTATARSEQTGSMVHVFELVPAQA